MDKRAFEKLLKNKWSVPTKSHIFTFWGNLTQISLKKWKWNSLWFVGSSYRYSPTLTNSPHFRRHIGNSTTKMQCVPSVQKAWPRSSRRRTGEDILHGLCKFLVQMYVGGGQLDIRGGGGILPIRGCAVRQGMVFVLSVLNRAYNFARVCPKQGKYFRASLS